VKTYRSPEEVEPHPAGTCLALGTFDGVHRGHQAILQRTVERARREGWRGMALTFDPHPRQVIAPSLDFLLLTPIDRRLDLIASLGLDAALVLSFDENLRRTEPEEFVERVVVRSVGARGVVCGYNFRFGRQRRGDVELLRRLGDLYGFAVDVCAPVIVGGAPVSSSRIRRFLREGRTSEAELLLGRPAGVDDVERVC
jgi:riboflavin kinase/FMN adenylyltransferase